MTEAAHQDFEIQHGAFSRDEAGHVYCTYMDKYGLKEKCLCGAKWDVDTETQKTCERMHVYTSSGGDDVFCYQGKLTLSVPIQGLSVDLSVATSTAPAICGHTLKVALARLKQRAQEKYSDDEELCGLVETLHEMLG